MAGGKAKLLRDDYCDGLGDCLPSCPTGAISFVEREAAEYNETEVKKNLEKKKKAGFEPHAGGCPGHKLRVFNRAEKEAPAAAVGEPLSRLSQWPVQIKLAAPNAPYFQGCDLLIAADCTAYACAGFHERFIQNRVTVIGCPKLDNIDYSVKLAAILQHNDIRSITVVRMEVPCCGGLTTMVKKAVAASGKNIPLRIQVLSIDGELLE